MPGQCCSTTRTQSRASLLAKYARQSVLCGILGSMKFIIALTTFIQAYVFLSLCKKGMHAESAAALRSNMNAARTNLRLGRLPAIEMFFLAPATFVGLHIVLNVGMIYCFAACLALMFTVCFTVRASGRFKGCPSIESPIYKDGSPFPLMKDASGDVRNTKLFLFPTPSLSIMKAYALALLFVPLRAVTSMAQAVLLVVELVSLPAVLVSDACVAIFRALVSKISPSSTSQHCAKNFQASKDSLTCALSLAKTLMTDMLWVMTLGVSGVSSLRAATKVRYALRGCNTPTTADQNTSVPEIPEEGPATPSPSSCCHANPTQKHVAPTDTAVTEQTQSQETTPTVLQNTTSATCCHSRAVAS